MLSKKAGEGLQKKIGNEYHIWAVDGHCPYYFSGEDSKHIYLLAWPKCKNEAIMKKLDKAFDTNGKIPKECIIIDPSFNRVTNSAETKHYRIRAGIHEFTDTGSKFTQEESELPFKQTHNNKSYTDAIPIGYLSDYLGTSRLNGPPNRYSSMLFFTLEKDLTSNQIRLRFVSKALPTTKGVSLSEKLEQKLCAHSDLKAFKSEIEKALL